MATHLSSPEPYKVRKRSHRRLARRLRASLISVSVASLLWSGWTLVDWHSNHGHHHAGLFPTGTPPRDAANNFEEARTLLTGAGKLSDKNLGHALTLLQSVIAKEPSHAGAQAMLAELLVKTGQPLEALKQLHAAVHHVEDLRMVLATLCATTGQPLAAREHAQLVIDRCRPIAVADLQKVDARLLWAQAELLLGNHESVETILARGRAKLSDPRYQEVYLQLQLKKATTTQDTSEALDSLKRIFAIAPQHDQALVQLGRMLSRNDAHAAGILSLLEELEAMPRSSQLVYQLLSGYHCNQGAWAQAQALSEKGLQQFPQAHALKNNLAWALAHRAIPDLPRALELVNDAVQTVGPHPLQLEYLATRGTLYGLSSRWTDAIADLEKVLNHLPKRTKLKVQLAESYTQVGQPELAASLLESSDLTDLLGN